MAMMMGAAGLWSVAYAFEIGFSGYDFKVFWAKVQYIGICAIPYAVVTFGTVYSGRRFGTRLRVLLAVFPVLMVGMAFTNERHGLVWNSIEQSPGNLFLELSHGAGFWAFWVYSYVLIVTGLAMITTVIFQSRRLYLMQSVILILGLLAPWLGNSLYVLDLLPADRTFDLTPLGFTVTGLLLAWGLFRFGLLDMVPVAHHRIVESMPDGVLVLDDRRRILDLNPAAAPLLGVPVSQAIGRKAKDIVAGWGNLSENLECSREVRVGEPPRDYELSLTTLDREQGFKRKSGSGVVVIFRDISERKITERKLKESEERYRRLVEMSPDAIIVHSEGTVDYINAAGIRSVGATKVGDLIGRPILDFVHPDYTRRMEERLKRTYEEGDYASAAEEKFVRLDGRVMDVETAVLSVSSSSGSVAQLVFREITARKAAEEQLAHQAFHDLLTGLPNRSLFTERLSKTLGSDIAGRVGVLFLDLDGFKLVNDSLGHEYGDALLAAVADRLRASVRPEDTVARMGGDEFTVLIKNVYSEAEAEAVARRIATALGKPFPLGEHEVSITTSIGIALGEAGGEGRVSEMLRNADAAMYEAKREGGTKYRIFRDGMADLTIRHLETKNDLRQALNRDEFVLHYQPKVSLETGEICGVEALLRWRHPKRGMLLPGEFMQIAENLGLMPEIGIHVLREALRQTAEWLEDLPQIERLTLGVNFSVRQLLHPGIAGVALELIKNSGLSPRNLEFEITEDALIEQNSPALIALGELQRAGVSLALDDFGTGYSSLSRLRVIPIDSIKIDNSLIDGLDFPGRNTQDATIVAGLVELTHALGKSVVAEGVEKPEQLRRLRELGCDFAQGNLLYPPLDAAETMKVLRDHDGHETGNRTSFEKPVT